MISFNHSGNFNYLEKFLTRISQVGTFCDLHRFGRQGVEALSKATPVDSGKTADSWSYEIHEDKNSVTITWSNSNVNDGVPIALILQYGHGTKNGGYVSGIDYINPAMKPIFDSIAESAWKEVIK